MIRIFKDADLLLPALADFIVSRSKMAIEKSGRFNFVLSGGSSPKKLYELLTSASYRNMIDWQHVFFFFGDERYLPLTDKDSNFLMARNTLFGPLHIAGDHIFPVDTSLKPAEAAASYELKIRHHFHGECAFDLVLLG